MFTRDDGDLLREYRSGSEDAFRVLAQRYGSLVYASCLKSLGRPELAEDASQAVFLLLARKAGRIHVRTTLIPWLLATSRIVCQNAYRTERRLRRYEQPLEEDSVAVESAQNASIFEALEKLRDPEREAIVLRFVQGLSLEEVGKAQGVSEDAARMRIQRAVGRLRKSYIPNIAVTPSLLNRLSNPGIASAAIQRLALRSTTMFKTTTVSAVLLIGVTGAAAVASFNRPRNSSVTPPAQGSASLPHISTATRTNLPPPQLKVPTLGSPFTFEYRVTDSVPNQVTGYLTISSDGKNFLAIQRAEDNVTPNLIFLTNGRHFYGLMPGSNANMWVTNELSLSPSLPFSGVNFPAVPVWVKSESGTQAAGDQTGEGSKISTEISAFRFNGWDAHYMPGMLSVETLKTGVHAVTKAVVGEGIVPAESWKLGDYQTFQGVPLALTSVNSHYNIADGEITKKTRFELLSARPEGLPPSSYLAEHYLIDGNNVEYKIPMMAKMNLNFSYHAGSSIEQQARDQDQIEMKVHNTGAQP